jgi:plasmid stabilization system protein ParE
MQIQFTKLAREELLRIVSVFAEFAGARSANLFVERVRERGATLLKHPEIGHPETLLSDRKRLYRSISINKNYYFIYHVTKTTIWIVDIWDRRQNPARLTARIGK